MKKFFSLLVLLLVGCQAKEEVLQVNNLGQTVGGNRVFLISGWATSMPVYKRMAFNICHSRFRILDGADGKENSILVECLPGDG